jgi:hypothetical protein
MQNRRDQRLSEFATAGDLHNMPLGEPIEYRASVTARPVDRGSVVHMNSASANTFTIPSDATTDALYGDGPFPVGTIFAVAQWGAGQTTLVAGTGVTFRNPFAGLALSAQYTQLAVRKVAANEWHVMAMG